MPFVALCYLSVMIFVVLLRLSFTYDRGLHYEVCRQLRCLSLVGVVAVSSNIYKEVLLLNVHPRPMRLCGVQYLATIQTVHYLI